MKQKKGSAPKISYVPNRTKIGELGFRLQLFKLEMLMASRFPVALRLNDSQESLFTPFNLY